MGGRKGTRRRRQASRAAQSEKRRRFGRPTTGGTAPGGAGTGLRQQTDITATGGGAAGVRTGGVLPSGAGGGTGTGAGGLGTGLAGIGGTRLLTRGAGRPGPATVPSYPGPRFKGTKKTSQTVREDVGAKAGEAGTRSGIGGVEPEQSPAVTERGAGTGREASATSRTAGGRPPATSGKRTRGGK